MNSVKAGPLWSWRTSGTVLSANRSKPFRCRAYCCMGPAVAVTEVQVIFIPKYFIKKLIALTCKLFFFFFQVNCYFNCRFSCFRSLASMALSFPNSPHSSLTVPPACPWKSFLVCLSFEVRFCSALLISFTLISQRFHLWAQQPSLCWCLTDLPFRAIVACQD